jgi:hypothetical protein
MDTAIELEEWLRKEAGERIKKSESRRYYARTSENLSEEDRKIAHTLAEQMMGRKLPKTSRAQEKKNAQMEERIASKLDREAATLLRFADFVRSSSRVTNEA